MLPREGTSRKIWLHLGAIGDFRCKSRDLHSSLRQPSIGTPLLWMRTERLALSVPTPLHVHY